MLSAGPAVFLSLCCVIYFALWRTSWILYILYSLVQPVISVLISRNQLLTYEE